MKAYGGVDVKIHILLTSARVTNGKYIWGWRAAGIVDSAAGGGNGGSKFL
jgi:hypothetical protein